MRTVTLDDDAYRLLERAKAHRGESFSEVVKRAFGGAGDLRKSSGSWKSWTKAASRKLRREAVYAFGLTKDEGGRRRGRCP